MFDLTGDQLATFIVAIVALMALLGFIATVIAARKWAAPVAFVFVVATSVTIFLYSNLGTTPFENDQATSSKQDKVDEEDGETPEENDPDSYDETAEENAAQDSEETEEETEEESEPQDEAQESAENGGTDVYEEGTPPNSEVPDYTQIGPSDGEWQDYSGYDIINSWNGEMRGPDQAYMMAAYEDAVYVENTLLEMQNADLENSTPEEIWSMLDTFRAGIEGYGSYYPTSGSEPILAFEADYYTVLDSIDTYIAMLQDVADLQVSGIEASESEIQAIDEQEQQIAQNIETMETTALNVLPPSVQGTAIMRLDEVMTGEAIDHSLREGDDL